MLKVLNLSRQRIFQVSPKLKIAPIIIAGGLLLSSANLKAQNPEKDVFETQKVLKENKNNKLAWGIVGLTVAACTALGLSALTHTQKEKEALEILSSLKNYSKNKAQNTEPLEKAKSLSPEIYKAGSYKPMGNVILSSNGQALEEIAISFSNAPENVMREISTVQGNSELSEQAYNKLTNTINKGFSHRTLELFKPNPDKFAKI